MKPLIIFITILLLSCVIQGKDVVVSGSYNYVLPSDVSESDGRMNAVEKARLQALADEFGTFISSEVWMDVKNDNTVSSTSLWQLGSSLVRGTWIKDIKQPTVKKSISEEGETVITATVWGLARRISSSNVDLKAFLTVPGAGVSQSKFVDGSRFMLSFKSPVRGYVSVYLFDENEDICRLLPFALDEASSVVVNPMEQYDFFNTQRGIEEQYVFKTFEKKARNVVYIIFSKNEYTRPLDSFYVDRNLRILTKGSFLDWLSRQKAIDTDLTVVTLPVEIVTKD